MSIPTWHVDAELPALHLWWRDELEALIDFSAVDNWQLRVGVTGCPAVIEKTTGITGAAGAGVSPTGTPNVAIVWTAGELNVAPGTYVAQLRARWGSNDRVIQFPIRILPSVLAPAS